ncbi:MAG: hypothetical protein LBR97_04830 [Dysgonamonadaceae bacterium]|nr:hypothetical protein [Dysgonamonadaceae bacterium]
MKNTDFPSACNEKQFFYRGKIVKDFEYPPLFQNFTKKRTEMGNGMET